MPNKIEHLTSFFKLHFNVHRFAATPRTGGTPGVPPSPRLAPSHRGFMARTDSTRRVEVPFAHDVFGRYVNLLVVSIKRQWHLSNMSSDINQSCEIQDISCLVQH